MELNEKTYETYLLSYIDNELSHSERLMVERFVKSEPKYTAALKDLQNAILQPETIVFEDKALLYRLEEMNASLDLDFKKSLYRTETATPTTPVISLWNRNVLRYSAIAALFVLTIGTAIMLTSNKDKAIVLSANNSIPEAKKLIGNINDGIVSPTQALNSNQPSQVLAANTKSSVQLVGKSKTEPFQPISIGVEHTIIASSSNTLFDNKNTLDNNTTQVVEAIEAVASIEKVQINKDVDFSPVIQNTYQAESFEEINTSEPDRVIYISSIEIDSDKIRGFTRRINALFKRNKSDKQ